MKRQTFTISQESEILIYEETYNENNKLVHYIDHQARPVSEKKYEYDDNNQIVNEIEISDGIELQNLEMKYNDKGEMIEQNLYFSGSLYESVKIEKTDVGSTSTTYQEDDEVFRIESTTEEKKQTTKYYENGALSNVQELSFSDDKLSSEKMIYDADENLLVRRIENYNNSGETTAFKEFNSENKLVNKQEFTRSDNKLLKEVKSDFVRGEIENEVTYEYDEKGNLIKSETRTNSGQLVDFHIYAYDEENRMIEENGVSNGQFNAIYGTYINGNNYHFIHKYI